MNMKSLSLIWRGLLTVALAVSLTACNDDKPDDRTDTQLFNEGALITQTLDLDGQQHLSQGVSYTVRWYWDRNVADIGIQGLTVDGVPAPALTLMGVPFTLASDGSRVISGVNVKTYQNGAIYPLVLREFTLRVLDRIVTDPQYVYPATTLPEFLCALYVNIKVGDQVVTTMPRYMYYFAKTSVAPEGQPEQATYNGGYLPVRLELVPETMMAQLQIFNCMLYYQQQAPTNLLLSDMPFTTSGSLVTMNTEDMEFTPSTFESVALLGNTGTFTLNGLTAQTDKPVTDLKCAVDVMGRMRLTFKVSPQGQTLASLFTLDGYLAPQE